ncbi:MAG: hydrogenase 4 subunit B [Vicinamibacteria bacterium]|nr:hydrogenase 4 subunit B [Vicinamibacteria bacterium]
MDVSMAASENLVPLALLVHLGAAAAALALFRVPRWCRRVAFTGAVVASSLTTAAAVIVLASGEPLRGPLLFHQASGFTASFAVAPLSAGFLLVLGLLAVPIAVYSLGYLGHGPLDRRSAWLGAGFNLLVGAMALVFVADDVLTFLFAWELMSLSSAALVATEHERSDSRRAAFTYVVMSHVGTGCLMAGFFVLASLAGSISFTAVLSGALAFGGQRDLLFVLFLIGFGVKAGTVPLHVWLPDAHPAAPSSISALMSGVLVKTGVYGLFRVCAFGLGTPRWEWGLVIASLGALTAVLGVLYALAQVDLKRLLAYSTIENVGVILLGLGAGMMAQAAGRGELAALGVAASLFHALNHALFKGLLFLGAGGVVMATGTRNLERMGGLVRRMPRTALLFLVGAAALSGLPLLNGFASEWLLFQVLLLLFQATPDLSRLVFPVAGALLALTTALAATAFVKAFGIAFLALPRSEGARLAHDSPRSMLWPQAVLAAGCITIGVAPGLVLQPILGVAASLTESAPGAQWASGAFRLSPGPGHFDHFEPWALAVAVLLGLGLAAGLSRRAGYAVRTAPTWGCGGELSAATEYTATAFAKPLMMVFRSVYRPTRKVELVGEPHFPSEVKYQAGIEPTFERFIYQPLMRGVMAAAERMRVIQAGSLHAYLAYVLVLGIAVLIWLGGGR